MNAFRDHVATYDCADDLMQAGIKALLHSNDRFEASRGKGREIVGINFRLDIPRARLSRSETRGKVFSALGELFWCLSGSNEVQFIEHYIKDYGNDNSDDGKTVYGAYGPRMFGVEYLDQVRNVVQLLQHEPNSRRAVIQLYSSQDILERHKDIPCTCTLQAILREGFLHLVAHMRSNDAYLGLPHDIFVFTMLQELIARALDVDVGFYQHMVGHFHLYDRHEEAARAYLEEEYQSIRPMRSMPNGDPLVLLPALREAEARIRANPTSPVETDFDPYWADILRLLRIHSERHHKLAEYDGRIAQIQSEMSDPAFDVYLRKKTPAS